MCVALNFAEGLIGSRYPPKPTLTPCSVCLIVFKITLSLLFIFVVLLSPLSYGRFEIFWLYLLELFLFWYLTAPVKREREHQEVKRLVLYLLFA